MQMLIVLCPGWEGRSYGQSPPGPGACAPHPQPSPVLRRVGCTSGAPALSPSTGSSPEPSTLASTGQSQVLPGHEPTPSWSLCFPPPPKGSSPSAGRARTPLVSCFCFQGTPVASEDITRDLSLVCYWLRKLSPLSASEGSSGSHCALGWERGQNLPPLWLFQVDNIPHPQKSPEGLQISKQTLELLKSLLWSFKLHFENNDVSYAELRRGPAPPPNIHTHPVHGRAGPSQVRPAPKAR